MSLYSGRHPGSVAPSTLRRQKHADLPFRLLDLREIADSMNLIVTGFRVSEDPLARPTSHFTVALYGELIAYFVGITEENIRSSLKKVDDISENTDADPTAVTFALLRHVSKFLVDCGVDDFNITDITKPESSRLRKQLSAVIAYAHFRELRMADHDDVIRECQEENDRFRELWKENEDLMSQISQIEEFLQENSARMKETQDHNSQVEAELRRLKRIQEQLTDEYASYKSEKKASLAKIEEQSGSIRSVRGEIDRIRHYLVEPPEALHRGNQEMSQTLEERRNILATLEKRSRDLDTSMNSLREMSSDLKTCLKIIEECEEAVSKEQQIQTKLVRVQDGIEQRRTDVSNLDIRISQLQTQITNSEARIRRAQEQAEQKRLSAESKLRELQELQGEVIAERTLLGKQMDEKRAYIEAQERKMKIMRDDIEKEMKQIALESDRLQGHIEIYLEAMGSRLG